MKSILMRYGLWFFLTLLLVTAKGQEISFIHYTTDDGLPYSAITDFEQDLQGFMWISMRTSVCRFDGYEFLEYQFYDTLGKQVHLMVPRLLSDNNGDIFVATSDFRLFEYSADMDLFNEIFLCTFPNKPTRTETFSHGGFLFIENGRVRHHSGSDGHSGSVSEIYPFAAEYLEKETIIRLAESGGKLWLLTLSGQVLIIDAEKEYVNTIDYNFSAPANITLFRIGKKGFLWVCDSKTGLTRMSENDDKRVHFSDTAEEGFRIPHNMVRSIVYDPSGNVWMGTENGLAIWNPLTLSMSYKQYDITEPDGLNSNAIYNFFADKNNNIWIGTYFGGINIWYAGEEFFEITSSGTGKSDLGGKEVRSITEDGDGNIWVGLEGNGVNMIDVKSGEVTRYVHDPEKNSLSYNNVHTIFCGPDNKVYIGTYTGGLNILDRNTGIFTNLNTSNSKLPGNNIYALLLLNDTIYIGTDNGIAVLNPNTGALGLFKPEVFSGVQVEAFCLSGSKVWIPMISSFALWDIETDSIEYFNRFRDLRFISFITSDSKGSIWTGGSYSGLYCYDQEKDTILFFSPESGFPDSRVFGVVEGYDGWYWASCTKGLIRFRPDSENYILYDSKAGLPFNQFNYNAYFKDSKGRIHFGGINGLVSFRDSYGYQSDPVEEIVFSRIEVLNRRVMPGSNSVIKSVVNLSRRMKLKYEQKIFTVYFSALNFTHPGRVQYSYYLEGFSDEIQYSGNRNSATYTNLSPGKYKLHVRASIDNHTWSDHEAVLSIVVKPPFLLSAAAYIIYTFLILGILLLIYRVSVKIEKTKALAIIERNEKLQEKKLSQSKLEFFTNVSHDLRTPLTLIIGPLSSLLGDEKVKGAIRSKIVHINDNARRLLNLINQLMEFRKTDLGQVSLKVSEGDINIFVREIMEAFDTIADLHDVHFRLENRAPFEPVWFDHEKVERILFNLLSNAFRFTSPGGEIVIRVAQERCKADRDNMQRCLLFEVADNGIGIDRKSQNRIFEMFYQDNGGNNEKRGGSGIGLALVKNLVHLHKGEISVNSEQGKGSVFRFMIPCEKESYDSGEIVSGDIDYILNTDELLFLEFSAGKDSVPVREESDNPLVLVVDDNSELLSFLSEILSERFRVATATNGDEALDAIESSVPDLIISDIIMPGMDGIELARRIKSDIATSHIPVILLTARTEVENKYEGLLTGADLYIEKPFYPHILIKHIENIILTRERLIHLFKINVNSDPAEITHSRHDREFIEKLTAIINDNIDNPDLDVSFLLSEMNISRSLLHLKLKKIANCSATGYVRALRLRKAVRLIRDEGRTISEAAYLTGFSSPAFFSRRFREFFGKSPSSYFNQ